MLPPGHEVVSDDRRPMRPWAQWFADVGRIVGAQRQAGTTAQRPAAGLWVGRRYFDTTLGKPVFVRSVNPAVWVDATGVTV